MGTQGVTKGKAGRGLLFFNNLGTPDLIFINQAIKNIAT